MKRILSVLLIIFLLTSTVACGQKDTGPPLVTACIAGEPITMDPGLSAYIDASSYLSHVFEGLTTVDKDLDVAPGTAISWTISPDGTVYTFSIHPDAKWSDGTPVTALSFVYAWKRLVDPTTKAACAYLAYPIKNAHRINFGELPVSELGVEALGASTLRVTLEAPCSYFLSLIATPAFFPVREDVLQQHADWSLDASTFVGNGPFVMKDWSHRSAMTLEKNPYYWNQSAISNIDLQFFFMTNADEIYRAFKKGDLQFASNIPPSAFASEKKEGRLMFQPLQATYSLLFNTAKGPYDDERVRKALSLAIDRNYLIKSIWLDERKPAGAFVPPGVPEQGKDEFRSIGGDYFDSDDKARVSNAEEARSLLTAAGFENGAGFPEVNLLVEDNPSSLYIAHSIQQQWYENLGVAVYINNQRQKTFRETSEGNNWDLTATLTQATFSDPMAFLNIWNSDSGQNIAKYMNPDYDRLLNEANVSTSETSRLAMMHSAEDILIGRDMAMIPLSYGMTAFLMAPELKGVVTSHLGQTYFMWAEASKKKHSWIPFL